MMFENGKNYCSCNDAQNGHSWLVFPFLFELHDNIEIKTDWEASEWGWYTPDQMKALDTVPGLVQAFEEVWPAFGDDIFWDGLAAVASDTDHGATELARQGLDILGGYVQAAYRNLDNAWRSACPKGRPSSWSVTFSTPRGSSSTSTGTDTNDEERY
jgi:hypothetical protein